MFPLVSSSTLSLLIHMLLLVSPVANHSPADEMSLLSSSLADQRSCEPIKIEMCKNLGYDQTGMPNLVGNELQQDAELQFTTFLPLIQYGCSSKLRFFLCSVYTPMCTEKVSQAIGPCRSLCESVKNKCNSVLEEFGYFWPSALNCSKFPTSNNQETMCMDGPDDENDDPRRRNRIKQPSDGSKSINELSTSAKDNQFGLCRSYKFSDRYYYIDRSERCAHDCDADILYSQHNKSFTVYWIAAWSTVCFISSIVTVIAFMRSSKKSLFHERIILYLAINYAMYSSAYILRLIIGRKDVSCQLDQQHQVSILVQDGLDQFSCTIIFVLLYFFGMSSMVWWVILCLCLYLVNVRGKKSEDLDKISSLCHSIAWSLPALKTIAILVGVPFGASVDADELTGLCYIGNQRTDTLLVFVIIPYIVYIAIGLLFFCLSWWRKQTKRNTLYSMESSARLASSQISCFTQTNQLTDVTDRIILITDQLRIFSLFFAVPATSVLAINLYDYFNQNSWYFINRSDESVDTSSSSSSSPNGNTLTSSNVPNVELFILKFFMSLITGLLVWAARLLLESKSSSQKSHQAKMPAASRVVTSLPYGDLSRAGTASLSTLAVANITGTASVTSSVPFPKDETFSLHTNSRIPSSIGVPFTSYSLMSHPHLRLNKPETHV